MSSFKEDFGEALGVLQAFMAHDIHFEALEQAGATLVSALQSGGKIISCGNGGSMSDAMHFAEELTGRFRENRKALAAMAISDPAHISCVANDFGYDAVFSRFVEAHGNSGDVLLTISTSGNSPNVCKAAQAALDKGMKVVALTGKDGGQLAQLSHVHLNVPHHGYSDRVQEIHILIIHAIIHYIELNM